MTRYLTVAFFLFSLSLINAQSDGFTDLFNGQNLDGWTAAKEKPNSFIVEDGLLKCVDGRSHLFYTGSVGNADFKNFELKVRAKTTKGSNSGVYFHTKYQEEGWPEIGFEAQVNSTNKDAKKTGSLYGVVNVWAPDKDKTKKHPLIRVNDNHEAFLYQTKAPSKDGKWFDYHILVKDQTITIKVNGETQVVWTQPADWDREGRRIGSGTIGLQAHDPDSEVHYESIKIKVLE
ncbi:MAG: DUF1080 domain-containing protein [Bacteroidota bacterium]